MVNTGKRPSRKKETRHFVTITVPAREHLMRVIRAKRRNGYPTNQTMLVSELILAIPIPNGTKPVQAAEISMLNTEAKP